MRIKAGVEPDCLPALHAPVDKRHLAVEAAELRNPDVTIRLKRLGHIGGIDRIKGGNAWQLAVDERGHHEGLIMTVSVLAGLVPGSAVLVWLIRIIYLRRRA